MKLTIEQIVGDTKAVYNIEGDYEEVLAIADELGFCKENIVVNMHNVVCNSKEELVDLVETTTKQTIFNERRPGGMLYR